MIQWVLRRMFPPRRRLVRDHRPFGFLGEPGKPKSDFERRLEGMTVFGQPVEYWKFEDDTDHEKRHLVAWKREGE